MKQASATQQLTSTPAMNKWQPSPYGSYEPKRNMVVTSAAAPLSSAPAATVQMFSGMYRQETDVCIDSKKESDVCRERDSERACEREREIERSKERQIYAEKESLIHTQTPSLSLSLTHTAPAKRWTAPSGYVPGGSQTVSRPVDAAPRSSAPSSHAGYTRVSTQSPEMTIAPARKWQPYGGYEPKRDRQATPAPAASLSSAPAATAQMSSGMYRE
jgi:hypothetical protein